MNNRKKSQNTLSYIEKIINIRRVAKVVKGGRRFSFSALIVVGNGENKIGFGLGKAKEISEAIRKGKDEAVKKMIVVTRVGKTIPHKIYGKFGAGLVLIMPGIDGTGLIAGGTMRAIFESLGINNILAKSIRSTNSGNIVRATINALSKLKTYQQKLKLLKN